MKLSSLNCLIAGVVAVSATVLPRDAPPDDLVKRQNVPVTSTFSAVSLSQMKSDLSSSATATKATSTVAIGASTATTTPATSTVVIGASTVTATKQTSTIAIIGGPTATVTSCAKLSVRVEWRKMTAADKSSLMQAIRCLWQAPPKGIAPPAKSRYEELVWVHQQMTSTVHQDGIFLPWHRYFVWIYESMLRQECGYRAPLPWWHEPGDAGNFAGSGLFTSQYYGSLPQINSDGTTTCITDAAFQSSGKSDLHIGPGTQETTHCLARGENTTISSGVTQDYVDYCASLTDYPSYERCNEYGPHGLGHNAIGGSMSDVSSSPGDPIFFQHHAAVDQWWNGWQALNTSNLLAVGGFTTPGCTQPGGTCNPMTWNSVLTSLGLKQNYTVLDMLDITAEPLCYIYDS